MSVTKQPIVARGSTNPYLVWYLANLAARPILTKSITSGTLSFIQEIAAGYLAGTPPPAIKKTGLPPVDFIKRNQRAFKLAAYGFFISAPLSHSLMGVLQRAFAGQTGTRAKVGMIVASNVLVSPVINTVYLSSLSIINEAHSVDDIIKFIKMAIWPIMKLTWISSPLSMAFAQHFLSPEQWVPFFALVSCVLGTWFNTQSKKKYLAAQAKAQATRDADKAQ